MSADIHTRYSSLALAFSDAFSHPKTSQGWRKRLLRIAERPAAGIVRERKVNANVSYRTAQQLKQQGVL
jgi:hypothetical protein